jgi:hypothetical protein
VTTEAIFDRRVHDINQEIGCLIFTSTYVVNSNVTQAIQHYVIKFVSDLWQVGGKYITVFEDQPKNIPTKFGNNWLSGFREED